MTVKAPSYLVRNLVRNLVRLLVNNARKETCSYRTARYCAAATRCELGLWMPTTQASPIQATSVYLTGFPDECWDSGVFPRNLRHVFGCRPLGAVGTLLVLFAARANGVGA